MTETEAYPGVPATGPVVVTYDGDPVTDVLESAADAFVWILSHQAQPLGDALSNGYKIVAVEPKGHG